MFSMKALLIDDMRTMTVDRIARTYDDGISALKESQWDILYLDHDLGDEDPHKTGYGIMLFLEENKEYLPKEIVLVTANPVGRIKMQVVIDQLYSNKLN